jgi:hypothetical protein
MHAKSSSSGCGAATETVIPEETMSALHDGWLLQRVEALVLALVREHLLSSASSRGMLKQIDDGLLMMVRRR